MIVLIIFFVIGLILGLIRKGSFANISEADFKTRYLFVISIILFIVLKLGISQNLAFIVDNHYLIMLIAYSTLLLGIFFNLLNAFSIWMVLLLLGTVMNFAVIFINGGAMPYSESALKIAGISVEALANSPISIVATTATRFAYFGAIIPIPIPIPVLADVISPGTALIGLGIMGVVQNLLLGVVYVYEDEDEEDEDEEYFFTDKKTMQEDREEENDEFIFGKDYTLGNLDNEDPQGSLSGKTNERKNDLRHDDESDHEEEFATIKYEPVRTEGEIAEPEQPHDDTANIKELYEHIDRIKDTSDVPLKEENTLEIEETFPQEASSSDILPKEENTFEVEETFPQEIFPSDMLSKEENTLEIDETFPQETFPSDIPSEEESTLEIEETFPQEIFPSDISFGGKNTFDTDKTFPDDLISEDTTEDDEILDILTTDTSDEKEELQNETKPELQEYSLDDILQSVVQGEPEKYKEKSEDAGQFDDEAEQTAEFSINYEELSEDTGALPEVYEDNDYEDSPDYGETTEYHSYNNDEDYDYAAPSIENVYEREEELSSQAIKKASEAIDSHDALSNNRESEEPEIDVSSPFIIINGRIVENPYYKFKRTGRQNMFETQTAQHGVQDRASRNPSLRGKPSFNPPTRPQQQKQEEIDPAGYEKVEMKIGDVQLKLYRKDLSKEKETEE